MGFGILDREEIDRFAQIFYKGKLDTTDRAQLQGLVNEAVQRFALEDDEGRQEEFRQLLRSFMRFYIFVAQVAPSLEDTSLEKLYSYSSWLDRLLPNREVPHEIEVTDEMLEMQAFRIEKKQDANASLSPGDTEPLSPIDDFGANPYTDEERRSLSEIIKSFNERHGTDFTEEDFIVFEKVTRKVLNDGNMIEMLRNNSQDVVYPVFREKFFDRAIYVFDREDNIKHVFLDDEVVRNKAIRHFFNWAFRKARETSGTTQF